MAVRTFVGFVADFPSDRKDDIPPGEELANFIQSVLSNSGFHSKKPNNREGWAWEIHTKDGDTEILTIVGLVDDMESDPPRQWLITNDCDISLLKKLFAKKRFMVKREDLLRRFCETIHNTILKDSRFSHVYWYFKKSFDQAGDKPALEP